MVQAVLLFGVENGVLSAVISVKIKGMHVGLLRQVTGKKERRKNDGS